MNKSLAPTLMAASSILLTLCAGAAPAAPSLFLVDADDIIFASTRCVQTVDCWWTEVANLYTCDGDGKYLRRLAFDQVHDNFPTVLDDGRANSARGGQGELSVPRAEPAGFAGCAASQGLGTLRGFPSHDVSRCCWITWNSAVFSGSRRAYV